MIDPFSPIIFLTGCEVLRRYLREFLYICSNSADACEWRAYKNLEQNRHFLGCPLNCKGKRHETGYNPPLINPDIFSKVRKYLKPNSPPLVLTHAPSKDHIFYDQQNLEHQLSGWGETYSFCRTVILRDRDKLVDIFITKLQQERDRLERRVIEATNVGDTESSMDSERQVNAIKEDISRLTDEGKFPTSNRAYELESNKGNQLATDNKRWSEWRAATKIQSYWRRKIEGDVNFLARLGLALLDKKSFSPSTRKKRKKDWINMRYNKKIERSFRKEPREGWVDSGEGIIVC